MSHDPAISSVCILITRGNTNATTKLKDLIQTMLRLGTA